MVSAGVLFVTGLILGGIAAARWRLQVREREAAEYQAMLLGAHRDAMRAAGRPMTTAALRETDPEFDEERFLERVRLVTQLRRLGIRRGGGRVFSAISRRRWSPKSGSTAASPW